jgi:hypothetical protein
MRLVKWKIRKFGIQTLPKKEGEAKWIVIDVYGGFHKWGYPISCMVYKGKSH